MNRGDQAHKQGITSTLPKRSGQKTQPGTGKPIEGRVAGSGLFLEVHTVLGGPSPQKTMKDQRESITNIQEMEGGRRGGRRQRVFFACSLEESQCTFCKFKNKIHDTIKRKEHFLIKGNKE